MEHPTYEPLPENQEDLNLPATKADLQNLATKGELKAEISILREEMNERFSELPTKEDFSRLLSVVDGLAGEVRTYNQERAAEGARLERIENWIKKAAKTVNVPFEL
jgi:hypothetical protein